MGWPLRENTLSFVKPLLQLFDGGLKLQLQSINRSMKLLSSRCVAAILLLVAHSSQAQLVDEYEFFYPKFKYTPAQPVPEGITYKHSHTPKTDRLSEDYLNGLAPMLGLDFKYNRKNADVNFFLNVSGIGITGMETITERGKYFKKIDYTIKSSVDCIDKNGATVSSLTTEDGKKVKSILVGANFFRQLNSDNNKYPKPADIPTIDANPGYVPSWEESFGKLPPVGFSTTEEMEAFVKKYQNYIAAKAEALAVKNEFENAASILRVLYCSYSFRVNFVVGKVKKTNASLPYNFDDLNQASEQIKSAYNIFSVNVNDTAAYFPLLRSAVSTITAIEAANEERVRSENSAVVQAVIQHNLSLANAWLLNMDEAWKYYSKYSVNQRYKPGILLSLQQTLDFMDKRAAGVKSGYSGNLLEKFSKQ